VSDFVTVPAGVYLCRIAEVRKGTTRAGDVRWSVRLVVAEGPQIGRQAAWDALVFSHRGRARARLVFRALGLPVSVMPSSIEGLTASIEIRPAEYKSATGCTVRRNEVPYDGWQSASAEGER